MNLAALLAIASCLFACPPNDAGTIVVVDGNLKLIEFNVPGSVDYRLTYDTSRLALFFDAGATQPAPPNTTFQSPPAAIEHGDMNLDGTVDGGDMQIFVDVMLGNNTNPILIAQADFDENGILNSNDTSLFVTALLSGISATSTVTLFAQGLSASAALCDTPVDILTDEDMNGTFVLAGTVEITVVNLAASPIMGPLGTAVTLTINPAISPLVFDTATTASWTGVYDPVVGPTSTSFTVQYSTSEFRESSSSSATVIVGDGTSPPPVPVGGVSPGTLLGTLTINLQGLEVAKPFNFQVPSSAVDWFGLVYPEDSAGFLPDPPSLANSALNELPIYEIPAEGTTPENLSAAYFFHTICVFRIAENATTLAESPATITVDIVTLDASGNEVDRVSDVVLTKNASDGDPQHITYQSDFSRPFVFVEGTIDPMEFPDQIVIVAEEDGTAIAVEATP
ncbi:MAG: hypothetical protein KF841_03195 [Phycisphaerae bacterium]|nr:hypothetical protein [Phycisphaerae bacterium]